MIIWLFPVIYKSLSPVHDFLFHSEQGRGRVWKSKGGGGKRGSSYLVGIFSPSDWNWVNWSSKIWGCHVFTFTPPGSDRPDHINDLANFDYTWWLFHFLFFRGFFTFSLSIVVLLKRKMCSGDIADFFEIPKIACI